MLGYETDDFAWTAIWPGSGFLGDLFERPFLARWELDGSHARSEQVPGVAVAASVHAGTIGVAPSRELFERARAREAAAGAPNPPDPELAWPPLAADGLRTYPPRENGGNIDIRDLGPGARLWLPVHVPGARLSVGDLHFAQGDGEVCISAIETGGSATFRIGLRRGGWRPAFPAYEAPPRPPRAMFATTGIPLDDAGEQGLLDLNLATRRALIELLGWLTAERGLEREAAYVLMSVAAELRVSELVDAPNALVSAALPLDVFEDAGRPGAPPPDPADTGRSAEPRYASVSERARSALPPVGGRRRPAALRTTLPHPRRGAHLAARAPARRHGPVGRRAQLWRHDHRARRLARGRLAQDLLRALPRQGALLPRDVRHRHRVRARPGRRGRRGRVRSQGSAGRGPAHVPDGARRRARLLPRDRARGVGGRADRGRQAARRAPGLRGPLPRGQPAGARARQARRDRWRATSRSGSSARYWSSCPSASKRAAPRSCRG